MESVPARPGNSRLVNGVHLMHQSVRQPIFPMVRRELMHGRAQESRRIRSVLLYSLKPAIQPLVPRPQPSPNPLDGTEIREYRRLALAFRHPLALQPTATCLPVPIASPDLPTASSGHLPHLPLSA